MLLRTFNCLSDFEKILAKLLHVFYSDSLNGHTAFCITDTESDRKISAAFVESVTE